MGAPSANYGQNISSSQHNRDQNLSSQYGSYGNQGQLNSNQNLNNSNQLQNTSAQSYGTQGQSFAGVEAHNYGSHG